VNRTSTVADCAVAAIAWRGTTILAGITVVTCPPRSDMAP
jgi:hypothetical protein